MSMKRLFHGSWLLPLYISFDSFDWCSVNTMQPDRQARNMA
jgi:hypothetical protein